MQIIDATDEARLLAEYQRLGKVYRERQTAAEKLLNRRDTERLGWFRSWSSKDQPPMRAPKKGEVKDETVEEACFYATEAWEEKEDALSAWQTENRRLRESLPTELRAALRDCWNGSIGYQLERILHQDTHSLYQYSMRVLHQTVKLDFEFVPSNMTESEIAIANALFQRGQTAMLEHIYREGAWDKAPAPNLDYYVVYQEN